MRYIEAHFLYLSIAEILSDDLNLLFINDKDLPAVLDFILALTNVSFDFDSTSLLLVNFLIRLHVQQRIDFIPNTDPPNSSNHLIDVPSTTSFLLLLNPSKAHFLFMNLPLEHHLYFPNSC
jgi:hypothetical protein